MKKSEELVIITKTHDPNTGTTLRDWTTLLEREASLKYSIRFLIQRIRPKYAIRFLGIWVDFASILRSLRKW